MIETVCCHDRLAPVHHTAPCCNADDCNMIFFLMLLSDWFWTSKLEMSLEVCCVSGGILLYCGQ
jgi:hypothetical protein